MWRFFIGVDGGGAQWVIWDEKDIVTYIHFVLCGYFMCTLVRCINTFKIRLWRKRKLNSIFGTELNTVWLSGILCIIQVCACMCEQIFEKVKTLYNDRVLLLVSNINFKLYNLRLRRHAKSSILKLFIMTFKKFYWMKWTL